MRDHTEGPAMAHSSRVTFSSAAARAAVVDDDDFDEEPGEVIESAPPLRVGEEREIHPSGLKKKLLRAGRGWETPVFGDEVTGLAFFYLINDFQTEDLIFGIGSL